MTEDAIKRLEGLWEEAQVLGFDLSWLAPSVKFGLISRSRLELQREGVLGLEYEKRHLEEKRVIMRCQLSTLTMLPSQNEQSRAAFDKQIQHTKANVKATEEAFLYRLHVEVKSIVSEDDLVDFRGLAMLPRCHTALLEKVAVCSGSRTPRWCKSACEMLAELLFFLHSTRMREMTEDACKRLKVPWEEAQSLGFDLSWLAPGVKFGLNSRSHLEQQRKSVLALVN